jgi:hypothetical protein
MIRSHDHTIHRIEKPSDSDNGTLVFDEMRTEEKASRVNPLGWKKWPCLRG